MKLIDWICLLFPILPVSILTMIDVIPMWEGAAVGYGMYAIVFFLVLKPLTDKMAGVKNEQK